MTFCDCGLEIGEDDVSGTCMQCDATYCAFCGHHTKDGQLYCCIPPSGDAPDHGVEDAYKLILKWKPVIAKSPLVLDFLHGSYATALEGAQNRAECQADLLCEIDQIRVTFSKMAADMTTPPDSPRDARLVEKKFGDNLASAMLSVTKPGSVTAKPVTRGKPKPLMRKMDKMEVLPDRQYRISWYAPRKKTVEVELQRWDVLRIIEEDARRKGIATDFQVMIDGRVRYKLTPRSEPK